MLNLQTGDIFADHYQLVRLIDTGGFTDVWEAIFLSAGNTVALKIYPKLDAEGVKNMQDEYTNQAELSHTHLLIARYFGKHNGYPYLEMRYFPQGNASSKINNCTVTDIAKCMCQVGSALAYLHENNIVHQDIKPNNFMLDRQGNFHLADLGLSHSVRNTIKRFTQSKSANNSYVAGITPPPYRAPELYDRASTGNQPVKATDIWAFGASLYELMTGTEPFGDFGGLSQHKSPEVPDLPSNWPSELNDIIKRCLAKETWDRPKASEISDWGHNYLNTGRFNYTPEEPQTEVKVTGKGATIPGSGEEAPEKRKSKAAYWLVACLLVAAVASGFIFWTTKNGKEKQQAVVTNSTVKKDSLVVAPAGDTSKTTNVEIAKPLPLIPKPQSQDPVKKDSTIVSQATKEITYKLVNPDIKPSKGGISIVSVKSLGKRLQIAFKVDNSHSGQVTVYGPENDMHCFNIQADGDTYRLLSISPKGILDFGSSGYKILTAVFEKPPAGTTTFDIMEGKDFTKTGMSYWNFRNVELVTPII